MNANGYDEALVSPRCSFEHGKAYEDSSVKTGEAAPALATVPGTYELP